VTWTCLDDGWDDCPKLRRAIAKVGVDAGWVWARAVTFCNRKLTDGAIHGSKLRELSSHRRPQEVVDALVEARKLIDKGDDEYEISNFLRWNKSRAEVEEKRSKKADAGKRGGEAKARNAAAKQQAQPVGPVPESGERLADASQGVDGSYPGSYSEVPTPSPSPSPSPTASSKQCAERTARHAAPATLSADVQRILDALGAHPKLRELAGDWAFAEILLGRAFASKRKVEWVIAAIGEAAADTPQHEAVGATQKRVRSYCDRARAPREEPLGQGADADPDERERQRLGKPPPQPVRAARRAVPWDELDGPARKLWASREAYEAKCLPRSA